MILHAASLIEHYDNITNASMIDVIIMLYQIISASLSIHDVEVVPVLSIMHV